MMEPEKLVDQVVGHYRIKQQIGQGGMATVFLARDIHLERDVAVKIFQPRPGETQDFLHRFTREARVLARLDHPQILPVYEYGEQGNLAFLVTPYLSGGTLRDKLKEQKVFPPSEAIALILQVLPALQYAHDRNLIHRDIKPGNLLFKADGTLILADFGLVKVVEEEGTNILETLNQTTQGIAGTPEYMAPEQIEGHAGKASDIYALGVVLYELVTGTRPFGGDSVLGILVKQVKEQPRSPRALNAYISPQLEAVIMRTLEKDPQKRFASPDDLQKTLQQINTPQPARPGNPRSHPGLTGADNPTSLVGDQSLTASSNWRSAPTQSAPQGPLTPLPLDQRASFQNTTIPAQDQRSGFQSMTVPAQNQGNSAPGIAPYGQIPASNQQWAANTQQQLSQPSLILPTQQNTQAVWQTQQAWTPPSLPAPPTAPQKQHRGKGTPIIVLAILLLLVVGVVGALFLSPVGASLLGKTPASTATVGTNSHTPITTSSTTVTPTESTTVTTNQALPSTQTSCPASQTARAAVLPALNLGTDATVVYIINAGTASAPTYGTLATYDTATGQKAAIVQDNHTVINEAQISSDGQWILFDATINGQDEMRLIRLDGQEQQTLLCAAAGTSLAHAQWSTDQQYIVFDEITQNVPTVYLLNVQTGGLQVEVEPGSNGIGLLPRTWLDETHVLLTANALDTDAPPQNIYVLDIDQGSQQAFAQITHVWDSSISPNCWDFDSSYDGSMLYIADCATGNPGQSTIIKQFANGNSPNPILQSSTLCITTVRVIDAQSAHLLLLAEDYAPGVAGDPQHDGVYLLTTSNNSLLRLTSTAAGTYSSLNGTSQYFWSNVSRDGSMYTFLNTRQASNEYTLAYGQLSGGTPTVFADKTNAALALVGWTTT